ncbi:T9SS type A sorting domain-containing protein [Aurantibacillus circumpalustris]|uniref:T9SS type A sorting domain-containing protein n=1 Tax=Aurantibacillus circumpalustris TaxID=3036359 RepID=UPI00295B9C0A|nr:T9SS type A sorting domain-containing protein [Aurantibacillus circumpalustris]
MRALYFSCLILSSILGLSQSFVKNNTGKALTFKDIQLQFDQFKKTHDLSTEKHWKCFKRYEMDMQLHTNGRGEPDGFADFITAALANANDKELSHAKTNAGVWSPVGPNVLPNNLTGYMENGIGRVNCVAFHPTNSSIFYVGVAQGGVWKTTNGGASYTPLTDNLPITRISDICIDPNNTNTIYISVCDFEYIGFGLYLNGKKRHTHYGLGIYKSTDGGLTWNPTGLSFQFTNGDASLMRKIIVNPSNSSEVIACGVSGMYKSTNGGTSWIKKLDSLFMDMVLDPITPNIIYAATGWVQNSNMGHAGIYKSTDFGNTWSLLNTGIQFQGVVQRIRLAIAPSDHNYVYALCADNTDGFYGMYQSTNAGITWTYKPPILNILEHGQGNGSGGQGLYDLALCVSATDKNTIYTGGINMWGSSDGGTTFDPVSHWTLQYGNTFHGDIHYIDRQPGTSNVFVCSDGGIYRSSNIQVGNWGPSWPTVWTKLNNGMQITSFYRLSSSKNSSGTLMAGAQDNASFYFNGTSWSTIFGGDGMDNYLNPTNNQIIIGSSQYGSIYYSNDGGNSGTFVGSNPNSESSEWVTPIVADYNSPGVIYAGNENVVKSTDGGQSWTSLGTIYTNTLSQLNTEICALAVANSNSNVIYAARRVRYEYNLKGIIFRSTNGGTSFTNITNNLPDTLYYTGIEVNPSNSNEACVCMAGFANNCKVFRTTNGGSSWTNISFNLPNIPVNCVKYLSGTGQLIIATDLGVYILNSGSSIWSSYSLGLPNVIISDIEFNQAVNKIYVSTFGRGIWETNLNLLTGLQENKTLNPLEFKVYPTVTKGSFFVELDGFLKTQITIADVLGRGVYSGNLKEFKTEIKLQVLPGTYYVKIENEQSVGVKKIIIE